MKKPYLWMLGKDDKFTVRTLYEMFKEKARSMPTLERVSLGTSIITEAIIMAENPSSKIPRDRLQRYMNYRLPKVAWVHVLGKSLGKPCETSSSSDPLCLHWDSTRNPTITEVLELEKINNDKDQRKDKDHSMSNSEKLDKLIQMVRDLDKRVVILKLPEKSFQKRAILEKNPTRVKGEKLRVCYKTLLHEDGVNPCKETIERCFIRPVPPECLNEGVVFKEGSVVDAYFNNGLWTGVIVVPDGSFFVYFDDPPDTMIFIRSQLRPHADWIGFKWVKSKNKVLSQHMFRTGKLVEMTREISESEKEKIWVRALVITEIQGGDRRNFLIKRCTSSQNLSDEAEGKHSIVDICKISPSPPRDLCVEYSLNDFVEVVVAHGWRKGRVTEILIENNYKVYFDATKEDALWALSSVNQLGTFFGIRDDEIQFPLCLNWIETNSLTIEEVNKFDKMEKVDVKCILGDPELHSDLVEYVDSEFGRVVDLVKRGYRLNRQDWLNGSVDIAVAEAEVDENNSAPGIDATDQEKIELLTKKVNGQNADYEFGDIEVLQNYIDAKRQKIAKGKKNGVRPPREVDHQEEDDTEVEYGAKKSDTSKVNEEQPQEEEEHQEEDDTEVDVDDSAKGNENSETNKGQTQDEEKQQEEDDTEVNADVDDGAKGNENSETNEDGEVNEDASKNPVKEKKKSVKPPHEVQQQVEDDAEIGAKESENSETNEDGEVNKDASKKIVKGMKKVQQQVEDDAEVDAKESENPKTNEDGEVNEDASKKPLKFTKKHGRGNKEPNVDTSKSKRQKKHEDSAGDVS
ncbi:LOW QUALITY PROTEIN: hypothetical protein HID58_088217 [Brassica napus]|uniref:Agenet domain-containing protein n=1 Tax=Brassica napus TaxID=3708 RepID=A0ABQ7XVS0_BRANA|nr:LOW QUALITY PROTEIN: hypothetical protein HID58_088217 [Brassica napus]